MRDWPQRPAGRLGKSLRNFLYLQNHRRTGVTAESQANKRKEANRCGLPLKDLPSARKANSIFHFAITLLYFL
jgi:hypothetical protein